MSTQATEELVGLIQSRLELENLIFIPYGFLTLPSGKMSSRKGNFITAMEIIEMVEAETMKVLQEKSNNTNETIEKKLEKARKVAIAALKWRILVKDIEKDSILNIPEILNFSGNTGIYQLYTIVRINGILKKIEQQHNKDSDQEEQRFEHTLKEDVYNLNKDGKNQLSDVLFIALTENEKRILEKILTLPLIIERARKYYKPHHICMFLFELATLFNTWYGQIKVIDQQIIRQLALLHFILQIQQTMNFGLDLLGIETVDEL